MSRPRGHTASGAWSLLRRVGYVLSVATLLLVGLRLLLPRIGLWLSVPSRVAPVDAIVVFGGSQQRTLRGASLYHERVAPAVWQTGNYPSPADVELAIARGVPASAVKAPVTHSTWEDGQAVVGLVQEQQAQSILLVTDWFHARRSLGVLRKQLGDDSIAVFYEFLPPRNYAPEDWWKHQEGRATVVSELLKLGYYWLRYGIPLDL